MGEIKVGETDSTKYRWHLNHKLCFRHTRDYTEGSSPSSVKVRAQEYSTTKLTQNLEPGVTRIEGGPTEEPSRSPNQRKQPETEDRKQEVEEGPKETRRETHDFIKTYSILTMHKLLTL